MPYTFVVNGIIRTTDEDKPLLRYLRDDLKLYSVKDGCSEGACGTCTIIVDGRAMKSCVLSTKRAEGKNIVTTEGLSIEEKEAFVYAFGTAGSVQCGFCIPGMVMCGKALIDKNPDPSEDEIRQAIRGNICRCTGYKKIVDGIKAAAAIMRGDAKIGDLEAGENYGVGESVFRVEVRRKTLGYGKYPDDIGSEYFDETDLPPMAYVSAVRSKYPRAIVKKINKARAESLPGVLGVLTAEDVPNNKVGHVIQDWDVMIAEGDTSRMVGDAICLVVAESEYILKQAKESIEIEYEVLEPVRNIFEARAEGAPRIHESGNLCESRHVVRGDAAKALAEAKYTASASFHTPFTEHAFLEPECAVAYPYKNGVKVLSSDQGVYDTRREIAIMFGWEDEPERIVVENQLVGGGFGGKEDVTTQHIAALAAWKFGRPIKAKFSRAESLAVHPKRHAMDGIFTVGCDENGKLLALDCEINFDTGAYASLCGPVLERACTHSVGPYQYQNTDIRGYGYYTNNPPAGAFRGFGVCQSTFALESLLNVLASKVGISPWEIRYRNAIEPGKVLPNGQIADVSTALKETLEAVKPYYDANAGRAGIACAMKNAGVGVGLPDIGRAKLAIEDGIVTIYTAASDIGQGCLTVFCQDVAEGTGLPLARIRNGISNTENAPDSGTTSGSRQTLVTGEAVRGAAILLRDAMMEVAEAVAAGSGTETCDACSSPWSDKTLAAVMERLEGKVFAYEYYEPTDPLGADKPNPKSHIAYGYATNVAILGEDGKVSDIYAAYDAGKVINPVAIEGQIEGGVLMSMGYALTEDWVLEDCVPKAKYGTLGLLRATDAPRIHPMTVTKDELLSVAYGAKGVGEITTIPAAPAIAGAYYAIDGELRTKLPLENTPYSKKK